MSRVFAYCRVSTADQTTDNQVQEIRAAGFNIDPKRIVSECISGSTHASARPAFAKLLDRLEEGDVLVCGFRPIVTADSEKGVTGDSEAVTGDSDLIVTDFRWSSE